MSAPATSTLQVLLTELRHAHHAGLHDLVDQLNSWIESELSPTKPFESPATPNRETANIPRETADSSRELVSSFVNKSTLTNSTVVAETSRVRGSRKNAEERTHSELLKLLKPLNTLIRQRNLKAMGNRHNVEDALREYSDEQVSMAVRAIARLVRQDSSITSPIGLLVHHARHGSPDFFEETESTTPANPSETDDHGESPEPTSAADASVNIAAIRNSLRS